MLNKKWTLIVALCTACGSDKTQDSPDMIQNMVDMTQDQTPSDMPSADMIKDQEPGIDQSQDLGEDMPQDQSDDIQDMTPDMVPDQTMDMPASRCEGISECTYLPGDKCTQYGCQDTAGRCELVDLRKCNSIQAKTECEANPACDWLPGRKCFTSQRICVGSAQGDCDQKMQPMYFMCMYLPSRQNKTCDGVPNVQCNTLTDANTCYQLGCNWIE